MNTAVVTGAGRGLGRCIAQELAARDLHVIVTDIDERAAQATAALLGRAQAVHQDVRDPESHRRVAQLAQQTGPLAVWVNNAGVLHTDAVWDMSEDEIRRHVDINVLGVIWGARAAVDAMERGHIINIASMSALVPTPGLAVYGATKHAVLGFSLSLQGDLQHAGRPIAVSAICPDVIDTDMVRNVAHRDTASLLFSSRLLDVAETARRAVSVLDTKALVETIPRYRGWLSHVTRPFPRLGLGAIRLFRRAGERKREQRDE